MKKYFVKFTYSWFDSRYPSGTIKASGTSILTMDSAPENTKQIEDLLRNTKDEWFFSNENRYFVSGILSIDLINLL